MVHKQLVPTMKFFADTGIKCHAAFVVLLVWLFALASSAANACFLETDEPHSRAAKKSAATTINAPTGSHAQLGTDAGHHDDSDGTKVSCLEVCADGTHTLPKAYAGVDHSDPGPASLVSTLWTESPNVVSAPRRLDDLAISLVRPPLRVRCSRVAL